MFLWLSYKKKICNFFASLKSLKKGVRYGVRSGSAPKCHTSPTLHGGVRYSLGHWAELPIQILNPVLF
jgi:hypothetical protein